MSMGPQGQLLIQGRQYLDEPAPVLRKAIGGIQRPEWETLIFGCKRCPQGHRLSILLMTAILLD